MGKIILISGKKGSGKSRLAAVTKMILHPNAEIIKFAEPLYQMHDKCLHVLKEYGVISENVTKDRALLQVLGTEYGRQSKGKNVWVNAAKHACELFHQKHPESLIIIDDLRFKNEFTAFEDAFKVRLVCDPKVRAQRVKEEINDSHPSENDLDDFHSRFDLVIDTSQADPIESSKALLTAFEKFQKFKLLKSIG